MNFRDYKWFNNPRGLRNSGPYTPLDPMRYTDPRMGWAKLVVGGTEHLSVVPRLLGHGCMPIVQIYRERMGAAPADEAWFDVYAQYIKAGALWFEFYDEPNAPHFWPAGRDGQPSPAPDWMDREQCIGPVMDSWLGWAERIAAMGAYPAFPAMAETTVPEQSTVSWYEACLSYLAQRQADRFGAVIGAGLWCAVHPYLLNHFYQEPPGGPPSAARPYYQQSHKEGGWHFEYPFDPLQQHDDPGRTPFGGTAKSSFGDPNGLVCSGEIFTELLIRMFGTGPVPVVGTAGGIHPIPGAKGEPVQQDERYQGYSRESHAEATAAMYRWISESGPPWLLGLTLSTEADYYENGLSIPAMTLLAAEPPISKEGPDLDVRPGKVTQSMVGAAQESSPFDPFGPDEGTPAPVDEKPAPDEVPDMDLFMPEPLLDEVAPAGVTFEEVSPVDSGLIEIAPIGVSDPDEIPDDTAHADVTPVSDMVEEGGPAAGPGAATDQDAAMASGTVMWPAPEAHEEAPMVTPPPEEPAEPVTVMWPAPEAHEEAPEPLITPPPAAEPDPQTTSGTMLWPAPEAHEEAPESTPPPEQPAEPVVVMQAAEEVPMVEIHALEEAEPEPESEARQEVGPDLEEAMTSATMLWPAPDVREEAPEPPPVAPAAPLVVMPAPKPARYSGEKLGPGPGKVDASATEHWLMPADDLPADWVLGASRRYWDAFHTPIVSDPSLIGALPPDKSLSVTLLVTSDTARGAEKGLTAEWPNVQVDVVSGDSLDDLQSQLDRRAREGKEFG